MGGGGPRSAGTWLRWPPSVTSLSARYAHPTVEHFVPLFVALGAAAPDGPTATPISGFWLGALQALRAVRLTRAGGSRPSGSDARWGLTPEQCAGTRGDAYHCVDSANTISPGVAFAPLLVAVAIWSTSVGIVVPVLRDTDNLHSDVGTLVVAGGAVAEFAQHRPARRVVRGPGGVGRSRNC